ncbi:hypothetical protein BKA69DRAFT_1103716 [Paraphysoderma sedebokerense]|nr:hypothetical protein BKA69DRAFT_1103716 [Paraphysoderma sedebokerense]
MVSKIKADGINVWTENVTLPYWKRGLEFATLITPTWTTNLSIVGLGLSSPTPPEGIKASVVVVKSFDELREVGEKGLVKGNIVVFNPEYQGYSKTVMYRSNGAKEAAKWGAVAALVRSIAPYSIRSPHTGYSNRVSIPSAALSVEDANLLSRLYQRHVSNPLKYPIPHIHLFMTSEFFPDRVSRNVIAEIKGSDSELAKEVILLGGHIDSWDKGVGAQDDGAGFMVAYEALRLISLLPPNSRPKRTIRTVFFTGEEIGSPGGQSYFERYSSHPTLDHIFLLESDSGVFTPYGISVDSANPDNLGFLQDIASRFVKPNSKDGKGAIVAAGYSGADIRNWVGKGKLCVGWVSSGYGYTHDVEELGPDNPDQLMEWYFRYHHTAGDMMDIVSPKDLGDTATIIAIYAYLVATLGVPSHSA